MKIPLRKFFLKISIVLIGLLIGLVMAEIALRLFFPSPKDRTGYIRNKEGFRDIDHAVPKPPGTMRIAFQGDSFTYGQGVDFQHIFTTRVGEIMTKKNPEKKIEIFNFGIPGLDVFGDLDNIKTHVLKYDPDEIVFSFVLNDFSDARMDAEYLSSYRKGINRFKVFRRFEKYSRLAYVVDMVRPRILSDAGRIHLQWLKKSFDPSQNPRFVEMNKALEEIIKIVAQRTSVVVFFPYLVARDEDHIAFYDRARHLVKNLCDAYGCPFLEVLPLLKSKPYYRWWVSTNEHHPNAEAHDIIAAAIADKIMENIR